MKKTIRFILACLVSFSLAACGSSSPAEPGETAAGSTQEETAEPAAETTEETTEPTEEPEAEPEKSDQELIAETLEQLIGEWYCPAVDPEHLFFYEDGTGHYTGIDKDYSFTYSTDIDRLDSPNNGRYVEDLMTINYDNGETEEILFLIGDEELTGYPGQTKMLFQTRDHGGYSGIINCFDTWVKKEN